VNISGPINDFNKKLSTFFTYLFHLKCKTSSFLSNSVMVIVHFLFDPENWRNGATAQLSNGRMAQRLSV